MALCAGAATTTSSQWFTASAPEAARLEQPEKPGLGGCDRSGFGSDLILTVTWKNIYDAQ
jgi:hypothetical protein